MKKQKMIGFGQALKNFFHGYVDFKGCATRAEYWWVVLPIMLVNVGAIIIGAVLITLAIIGLQYGTGTDGVVAAVFAAVWIFLYIVAVFGLILPLIALVARRIHDCGFSAWVYYGPYLGWSVMSVLARISGDPMAILLMNMVNIAIFVWGLVLTLLPSKIQGNKYRLK